MPALISRAAIAIVLLCAWTACTRTEVGSVLVHVASDFTPEPWLDRVRIDVLNLDKELVATRDFPLGDASRHEGQDSANATMQVMTTASAGETLPFTFSLFTEDEQADALLRVRLYASQRMRAFSGYSRLRDSGQDMRDAPAMLDPSTPLELALNEPTLLSVKHVADQLPVDCDSAGLLATRDELRDAGFADIQFHTSERGRYRIQLRVIAPYDADATQEWTQCYAAPVAFLFKAASSATPHTRCAAAACNSADPIRFSEDLEAGEQHLLVRNTLPPGFTAQVEVLATPAVVGESSDDCTPEADSVQMPAYEPRPATSIDRLARITVHNAQRDETTKLVLHEECIGVAADVCRPASCQDATGQRTELGQRTVTRAVETPPTRVPVTETPDNPPCGSVPDPAETVLMPSAKLIVGDVSIASQQQNTAADERVVSVPAFRIDAREFSVARYRALPRECRQRIAPPPFDNPRQTRFQRSSKPGNTCTFGSDPVADRPLVREHEALPLTCVGKETARRICEAVGGRLPSGDEWERAALGTDPARVYPWGMEDPNCSGVVYGREVYEAVGPTLCTSGSAYGPESTAITRSLDNTCYDQPTNTDCHPIYDLGGNVAEWTDGMYTAYAEACQGARHERGTDCQQPLPSLGTVRGGSWLGPAAWLRARARRGVPAEQQSNDIGFRCVYPPTEGTTP